MELNKQFMMAMNMCERHTERFALEFGENRTITVDADAALTAYDRGMNIWYFVAEAIKNEPDKLMSFAQWCADQVAQFLPVDFEEINPENENYNSDDPDTQQKLRATTAQQLSTITGRAAFLRNYQIMIDCFVYAGRLKREVVCWQIPKLIEILP